MGAGLVGVRIVATLGDVKDSCGQTPPDELGDELQRIAELRGRISGVILSATGNRADLLRADLGIQGGPFKKIQRGPSMPYRAMECIDRASGALGHLLLRLVQFSERFFGAGLLAPLSSPRRHKTIILWIIQADALRVFCRKSQRHLPAHADRNGGIAT